MHANNFRQTTTDIESVEVDDGLIMYTTASGNINDLDDIVILKETFLDSGYIQRKKGSSSPTGLIGLLSRDGLRLRWWLFAYHRPRRHIAKTRILLEC